MANKNGKCGLADPISIKPFGKDDDQIKVIVETPKASNNKYAFDPDEPIFTLKTVLPAGMSFPYDFGFVPRTEAEDGDPLDVLIFMDQLYGSTCVSWRVAQVSTDWRNRR
jgi:inorganic pyrophosphatase